MSRPSRGSFRSSTGDTGGAVRWTAAFLVAGLVVLTAMLAGAAIAKQSTRVVSAEAPRFVASKPPPVTREYVDVYLIGDSVTAGGVPGKGLSYGYTLERILNWNITIDGIGSTGFVSKGAVPKDGGPTVDASFPTRLDDIVAAQPDVVVIAGGRNDIYTGRENVSETIGAFYRDLRAQLPDARIVTVSPWIWATTTEQQYVNRVDHVTTLTRVATESVGGTFIDSREILTPITDADVETLLIADKFHPNDEGHVRIGTELAHAFVAAGVSRGPEVWVEDALFSDEWHDATERYFG